MIASTPLAAALSALYLIALSTPVRAETDRDSPGYDSAFSTYEQYQDAELASWDRLNEQVSRAASIEEPDAGHANHGAHQHAHHGGRE